MFGLLTGTNYPGITNQATGKKQDTNTWFQKVLKIQNIQSVLKIQKLKFKGDSWLNKKRPEKTHDTPKKK